MRLSLLVALDRNHVIGREGGLPWHLPADLKRFKSITMGKPIIMGRKTHESIGHPLPGRRNIVLTSRVDYATAGCDVFSSLEFALAATRDNAEVMIVGGAAVYAEALPLCTRLYLTEGGRGIGWRCSLSGVCRCRLVRGFSRTSSNG